MLNLININIITKKNVFINMYTIFQDVKWLVDRLPNIKNITMVKKFSHMGFAISPHAESINLLIVKHLLENSN